MSSGGTGATLGGIATPSRAAGAGSGLGSGVLATLGAAERSLLGACQPDGARLDHKAIARTPIPATSAHSGRLEIPKHRARTLAIAPGKAADVPWSLAALEPRGTTCKSRCSRSPSNTISPAHGDVASSRHSP